MKNLYKIIGGIILFVLIFSIIQKCSGPEYIEKSTTTETKLDSVTIDSLIKVISYLESLPPDTVTKTLIIPSPIIEKDSTFTYYFPYRDSLLSARWVANTLGEVEFNSVKFDYILKRERRVIKETETITLTEYRTTTITKKLIESPKPYFTFGFEAGSKSFISPTVGFVTKKKYHIIYRYDLYVQSHNVGISIPIKF